MSAPIEHKRHESFDGTEIAYVVGGAGTAVVLANGLGAPFDAIEPIFEGLAERHRVLSWDYRGMHGSDFPSAPANLTVGHHCDDLLRILGREGIDRAVFCGWSMGVQVCFELARHRQRMMSGIVAICGAAGRPFETIFALPGVARLMPAGMAAMRLLDRPIRLGMRALVSWGPLPAALQAAGVVSKDADGERFRRVASGFSRIDFARYATMLEQLDSHDAGDVLGEIGVPTLIIAGERDLLTPPSTARAAHRAIRGSRLVMVDSGTHYVPIEQPELVLREIEAFLAALDP